MSGFLLELAMPLSRWCRLAIVGAVLLCCAQSSPADDTRAIVAKGKKATALVEIKAGKDQGWGSAFCIDGALGLFATNDHVASAGGVHGTKLTLVLNPGQPDQRSVSATLVKTDPKVDLAVIKVKSVGDLTALPLGDAEDLVETAPLTAFGYPFGEALTFRDGQYPAVSVNVGRVTSMRRDRGEIQLIQLDAAVNPGNSGGPVLDERGRVVGIIAAGIPGSGVNFAIPVNQLVRLLRRAEVTLTPNILPPERPTDPEPKPGPSSISRPPVTQTPTVRLPVPPAAAVAASDKIVRDVYSAQLANTTPRGRLELAHKMLDDAADTRDDPSGKYALMLKAREVATEAGDLQTAFDAINSLSASFLVDVPALGSETLLKIAPKQNTSDGHALLASYGLLVMDQLMKAQRYAELPPLWPVVQSAGSLSLNTEVKNRVAERVAYVRAAFAEYERIKPSLDALAKNPNDPAANDAAGKFYFVFGSDWAKGLPLLAKGPGTDASNPWKSLAARDLANPQTPEQQASLAEGWWNLSEQQTGPAKTRLEARAAMWYRRALPGLAGLARAVADKRVGSIYPTEAAPEHDDAPPSRREVAIERPDPPAHPPAVSHSRIVILSARWGGGRNWSDVTEKVKDLFNKQLGFFANPDTLGADPTPGWRKHLEITYAKDGEKKKLNVDEDKNVDPIALGR
jgi:S1-C subfamily serine protease